jgi:hypothetical protein
LKFLLHNSAHVHHLKQALARTRAKHGIVFDLISGGHCLGELIGHEPSTKPEELFL